ncbi:MAG: sugar phosphate isomerase/epimerase family protein [Planctomycetota bacterium]
MSRFRYCLNASTIATTPILEQLRVTKEAGYEAIELWHDHIDAYLAQGGTLRDLCRAVEDSGLIIPTTIYLAGWFQPAGAEHQKALNEVKRRLEQAAAVGARFAIAGPPQGKADRNLGAQHYAELLDIGRTFGVRPAFEYLGFVDDINTIDDAIDIIQRSGRSDATVVVDPFHCHRGGGSIESLTRLRADQIAISHFNDCPASPPAHQQQDSDRVFPGDGVVDLHRYCHRLNSIGYSGFLSLELFRDDLYSLDPLHVAKSGLEKMMSVAEI